LLNKKNKLSKKKKNLLKKTDRLNSSKQSKFYSNLNLNKIIPSQNNFKSKSKSDVFSHQLKWSDVVKHKSKGNNVKYLNYDLPKELKMLTQSKRYKTKSVSLSQKSSNKSNISTIALENFFKNKVYAKKKKRRFNQLLKLYLKFLKFFFQITLFEFKKYKKIDSLIFSKNVSIINSLINYNNLLFLKHLINIDTDNYKLKYSISLHEHNYHSSNIFLKNGKKTKYTMSEKKKLFKSISLCKNNFFLTTHF